MSKQPAPDGAGPPNPFSQIIALLEAQNDYLSHQIAYSVGGRIAHRMAGPGINHPHVYVLEASEGAGEAAQSYATYQRDRASPKDWSAFKSALRQARILASAAGIPFADTDPAFREAEARYKSILGMQVLDPSERNEYVPNGRIVDVVRIDRAHREEVSACYVLSERLITFSDHVRGAGFLAHGATTPADELPLSERQYDVLDAVYSLKAFAPETRVTTGEVAERLKLDVAQLKESVSALVDLEVLKSKKGRGGGVWLTEVGKNQVETQRKR